ncbi:hypothetical protein K466DRAFT_605183 [Polyporus arcularius HHB13444]|uniref:Uncharacterized protein n=1 Tax=Polyporus arcularius HHB13444 TaxID=1314778 RepID=A0A5C3NVQ2_9APHY|nr:hypothetical protein K466DRAFT_605183 [Polyporus arcularius HHB13444]
MRCVSLLIWVESINTSESDSAAAAAAAVVMCELGSARKPRLKLGFESYSLVKPRPSSRGRLKLSSSSARPEPEPVGGGRHLSPARTSALPERKGPQQDTFNDVSRRSPPPPAPSRAVRHQEERGDASNAFVVDLKLTVLAPASCAAKA